MRDIRRVGKQLKLQGRKIQQRNSEIKRCDVASKPPFERECSLGSKTDDRADHETFHSGVPAGKISGHLCQKKADSLTMRPVLPRKKLPRPFLLKQPAHEIPLIPEEQVDAVFVNQEKPAQHKKNCECGCQPANQRLSARCRKFARIHIVSSGQRRAYS